MNAKKCDRCGTLYEEYSYLDIGDAWRYKVVKSCHMYPDQKLDLCKCCLIDLEKWLMKGGVK